MTRTGQGISTGIGDALRAERERRFISIDTVARGTYVRPDFLQLIDDDRLHELPSGAYAKGFIRAYATFLGLDARPFVKVYDAKCGQPAPELSSVVQKGVRVPPVAHRRAWKIAIGSAAALVLLLGVFGAFRSGEDPAEAPALATTAARVQASTAPNPMGAVVQVEIIGEASWVEAEADDQLLFAGTLRRDETKTFKGAERVVLYLARAKEVRIIANGRILAPAEAGSYRGAFTPATTELPSSEPVDADSVAHKDPAVLGPSTDTTTAVVGVPEQ